MAASAIKKNDGLPQIICNRCINKLSPMETFYKKCKQVDLYLRSKLEESIAITKREEKPTIALADEPDSSDEDTPLFNIFFKNETPFNEEDSASNTARNLLAKLRTCEATTDTWKSGSSSVELEEQKYSIGKSNISIAKEFYKIENDHVDNLHENGLGNSDSKIKLRKQTELQTCKNNGDTFANVKQKRQQSFKLHCPVCNTNLMSMQHYIKHVRSHQGVLMCKICAYPFITKHKLHLHVLNIHFCAVCRKYFKDKRPHERMEHDHSFTPTFAHEKILTEKKQPEVNLCPICGIIIKSSIAKHMEIHSNASFKCNICAKVFVTKFRLQQHTKIHNSQRNYECDHCGNKFTSRHTLILHIKGVHFKCYTTHCPICGKVLSGRGYVKEHIKRHMGEKRFSCNICSDSFVNARSLKDHFTKHSTERPYICSFCPKAFKTKEGCKRHEKIHKGVTPHKCPVCFKGFIQRANMKSHFRYNHKGLDFDKEDVQYKSTIFR